MVYHCARVGCVCHCCAPPPEVLRALWSIFSYICVVTYYRMDSASIELLLNSNLSTIKSFFTSMIDSVKADVSQLRSENADLRSSLEFSQYEIDTLKTKQTNLESRLADALAVSAQMPSVENRVRTVEDWTRRKNLRISGLAELPNENSEQTIRAVQELVDDKLCVSDVKIANAFRVNNSSFDDQPRQIIANLISEKDKISCLKSGSKLKNTSIFINDDVSAATMSIRKTKLPELKRKRREGFIAYFSGAKLVTRRRRNNRTNSSTANLNDASSTVVNSRRDSSEATDSDDGNPDDASFVSVRNSPRGGSPRREPHGQENAATASMAALSSANDATTSSAAATAAIGAIAPSAADVPTQQPTPVVPAVHSDRRQTALPPSRVNPVRVVKKK